ncbi:MAG TPA: YegS/Rv2252/BmrU family lipid kinase [Bacteroidales bacterium]|nr:YegS/Rv2252/BmrU family lipid kinase [Bacteroidales bacterium]
MVNRKAKIFFIINPHSGNNKKVDIPSKILSTLNRQIFEPEFIQTETIKELSNILEDIKQDNNIIIAVGGDGTINYIINKIIDSDITFGIIPRGSGNGLARDLCIPRTINGAIAVINQLHCRKIDVMQIGNRYSVNVSGIGFDAIIADKFSKLKQRGFKNYFRITKREIKNIKPQKYQILIDGKHYDTNVYLISFANSKQWGNNAFVAPDAKIDDGLIDVVMLYPFPVFSLPLLLTGLFTKTINRSKYLNTIKAKKVVVKKTGDIFAHIDGEPQVFKDELTVSIYPRQLRILSPPHSI